jgi:hypothetical protein
MFYPCGICNLPAIHLMCTHFIVIRISQQTVANCYTALGPISPVRSLTMAGGINNLGTTHRTINCARLFSDRQKAK